MRTRMILITIAKMSALLLALGLMLAGVLFAHATAASTEAPQQATDDVLSEESRSMPGRCRPIL